MMPKIDPKYMWVKSPTGRYLHLVTGGIMTFTSLGNRRKAPALCTRKGVQMWRYWTEATEKDFEHYEICKGCLKEGAVLDEDGNWTPGREVVRTHDWAPTPGARKFIESARQTMKEMQ